MSNPLEIDRKDIEKLGDADFRTLVVLLCEAEIRNAGISLSSITAGGHQDAADGGLDVVVKAAGPLPTKSFIPRSYTGIQVKTSRMPPSAIMSEMRPDGSLRTSIRDLATNGGSYLIVTSKESPTDKGLRGRRDAMKHAIGWAKRPKSFHIDFLGADRVAQWVKCHPSLAAWVRTKCGRPITGWKGYENWAHAFGGIEDEYIIDDSLVVQDFARSLDTDFSVVDALHSLSTQLSNPRTAIRLTGLSGTGKTRFVQALFDERLSQFSLNRDLALYADNSSRLMPDPITFAESLVQEKRRAILIVDNCPPELHKHLADICTCEPSLLSLLTVEYDVRDDVPENTNAVKLRPASEDVIDTFLSKRFPHIGDANAQKIAKFSGGNYRIAIALASTVSLGESIISLRNDDLFVRLFWQRHQPNEALLRAAEACSLVYSFNGEGVESTSELNRLAILIETSSSELYRQVAELQRRDLVQIRGPWRAILPHAIANYLANRALASIPTETLVRHFQTSDERLLKSFARRLGFLHHSSVATRIATDWLQPGGLIGSAVDKLNDLGFAVFENIAPIAPSATLSAIEVGIAKDDTLARTTLSSHRPKLTKLIWHLAFDASLFHRAATILVAFAMHEDEQSGSTSRHFLSVLLQIRHSGTHASPNARATFVAQLLESTEAKERRLGVLMLESALKTERDDSSYEYDFGARIRDSGYSPTSTADLREWLRAFLLVVEKFSNREDGDSNAVRECFAKVLFGLWIHTRQFDQIIAVARQLHEYRGWYEGWVTVREILSRRKHLPTESVDAAKELEQILKPQDLVARTRAFALSSSRHSTELVLEDSDGMDFEGAYLRAAEIAEDCGRQLASGFADDLESLLPEVVRCDSQRVFAFGRGLAKGASDYLKLLTQLRYEYVSASPKERRFGVIYGYLAGIHDSDRSLFGTAMDILVTDNTFSQVFPDLQLAFPLNAESLSRLRKALQGRLQDVNSLRRLCYAGVQVSLGDKELVKFLRVVMELEGGADFVIEALDSRLSNDHSPRTRNQILRFARHFLSQFKFPEKTSRSQDRDYHLGGLIKNCITSKAGGVAARNLCEGLSAGITRHSISRYDYPRTMNKLANARPALFLDSFIDGDAERRRDWSMYKMLWGPYGNPFDQIPDEQLLNWCRREPHVRYAKIAACITSFVKGEAGQPMCWRPIAMVIVNQSPNPVLTLESISQSLFDFLAWSGSRASILEARSALMIPLQSDERSEVADWAKNRYQKLIGKISDERHGEARERIRQGQRFED
ncbi:conserved hypothetical protein [Pirellula staleyi DSM 6068]|uniref:Uncharacterized protein n=1 Tax=Pirellula staleyi (strain ATCC 27377 / DSM 6068 / ICPB 4128) TaxID=530564 RepID=D2R628_PIRSD|nr:hypothetical protein [Pirellula staleyi]ADB19113.1 conserved hypothetical protein [Pirellula staleyi DSM 6068]